MVTWGLTYEQFCEQPIALIHRLYQLHHVRPFLNSHSWIQAGTIAAATYNVHAGRKGKTLSHDDIFPFLKSGTERAIDEGRDDESQLEIHRKLNALLG